MRPNLSREHRWDCNLLAHVSNLDRRFASVRLNTDTTMGSMVGRRFGGTGVRIIVWGYIIAYFGVISKVLCLAFVYLFQYSM